MMFSESSSCPVNTCKHITNIAKHSEPDYIWLLRFTKQGVFIWFWFYMCLFITRFFLGVNVNLAVNLLLDFFWLLAIFGCRSQVCMESSECRPCKQPLCGELFSMGICVRWRPIWMVVVQSPTADSVRSFFWMHWQYHSSM